jgi:ornithine lipid ester-linked acyl 2-hydroxylase
VQAFGAVLSHDNLYNLVVSSNILLRIFRYGETLNRRFSKVGDKEFFDAKQFAWIESIENQRDDVAAELQQVLHNLADLPKLDDISPDNFAIEVIKGVWKTFFFFGYGLKFKRNCTECPKTTALLESIPGMKTAFFSILYPGTHIPPHRGPFNGVLRLHFGIIVPKEKEKCRIRVGNKTRYWEQGKCMIFDDTYEHEVLNDTTQLRVILFVDFKRPLPFWMHCINSFMIEVIQRTPYVKNAAKGQKDWEHKFYGD